MEYTLRVKYVPEARATIGGEDRRVIVTCPEIDKSWSRTYQDTPSGRRRAKDFLAEILAVAQLELATQNERAANVQYALPGSLL
jgi:hypothetical protein